MNTSQMMITLGAMVLLMFVIMRVNDSFLTTDRVLYNSKFSVLATSLASSIIEEANGKAFDASTDTSTITSLSSLTSASYLGPRSGETHDLFNDFDDYNNFTKIDSTMPSAVFKISCEVGYIDPSNPDAYTNHETWHKRIDVEVTSESMRDTILMSSIYSYWYFR